MISLQATGRYINPILETVELISNGQYSYKESRGGGTLKAIIYNRNNQCGTPMMIHGRDKSTEEFYLNICDSFFTHWHLPIFTHFPPSNPNHPQSFI